MPVYLHHRSASAGIGSVVIEALGCNSISPIRRGSSTNAGNVCARDLTMSQRPSAWRDGRAGRFSSRRLRNGEVDECQPRGAHRQGSTARAGGSVFGSTPPAPRMKSGFVLGDLVAVSVGEASAELPGQPGPPGARGSARAYGDRLDLSALKGRRSFSGQSLLLRARSGRCSLMRLFSKAEGVRRYVSASAIRRTNILVVVILGLAVLTGCPLAADVVEPSNEAQRAEMI